MIISNRLNSFAHRPELYWKPQTTLTPTKLIERAGITKGLTHLDLNFPHHFKEEIPIIQAALDAAKLKLNSVAVRYYDNPRFLDGALSHPNPSIQLQAYDMTLQGLEVAQKLGAPTVTLWLGQDGSDYSFQSNYQEQWETLRLQLERICDADPEMIFSLEYKASEPRAFSVLPTIGSTLMMIHEVNRPNLKITIDFCHSLFSRELPAAAAELALAKNLLSGIHLNDGYGYQDDGLTVASVHYTQTLELFYVLLKYNFEGSIYFDTDNAYLDPVKECEINIERVDSLTKRARQLIKQPKQLEALKRGELLF